MRQATIQLLAKITCVAAFVTTTGAGIAQAQDHSRVTLLPGRIMEDGQYLAGVRVELAPGWKTYWRAPGAGGIPPQFDWSGSRNVSTAQVTWPTPVVFETYGMRSIGYERDVVFPVLFTPTASGPIELSLTLDYGVCADICIPAQSSVSGRFDRDADLAPAMLNAALSSRAREGGAVGIVATCALSPGEGAGAWQLEARISGHDMTHSPEAVVEIPNPDLWVHDPTVAMGEVMEVSAVMDWFGTGAFTAARSDIVITLLPDGERAIQITGC